MKKVLIVGSRIPEGLAECLKGTRLQTNLIRFPEQDDFKEMLSSFGPHAIVFLRPTGEDEAYVHQKMIDDQTGSIPTLILEPSLWQRYAQTEGMDIHLGAIGTPQGIIEWIDHVLQ